MFLSECLVKFTCEAISLGLLFILSFFFYYCFNFNRCNLSIQIFCSNLVLKDCMVLKIYPFYLDCPVCWHTVIHNIFLQSFVFPWCQLLFFLFHFSIYLGLLSFFLMSLVKCLSILFIFSKKLLLDSLIFCIFFLDSTSFISAQSL